MKSHFDFLDAGCALTELKQNRTIFQSNQADFWNFFQKIGGCLVFFNQCPVNVELTEAGFIKEQTTLIRRMILQPLDRKQEKKVHIP